MRAHGIPAAPIQFLSDVIQDEHLRARGALVERKTGAGVAYLDVAPPWKFASYDRNEGFKSPAEQGTDTRRVLLAAGMTGDQIETLIEEGAAWAP
jgi:crotonobetainyl-CoA:carnitine CoA-transferase CaiB-like acyl-CoA transferase